MFLIHNKQRNNSHFLSNSLDKIKQRSMRRIFFMNFFRSYLLEKQRGIKLSCDSFNKRLTRKFCELKKILTYKSHPKAV